jgi:hypothetical protein
MARLLPLLLLLRLGRKKQRLGLMLLSLLVTKKSVLLGEEKEWG